MITEYVENYGKVIKLVPELIEISGFRNDFLAEKIGMRASNFSVKKMRGNWSYDEIEKLIPILAQVEDVEDYVMLKIMEERKGDENISLAEMKKVHGWK